LGFGFIPDIIFYALEMAAVFDFELTDGVGDQEAGSDEESIEGDAYQVEVSRC
jgi:hypothetical protein